MSCFRWKLTNGLILISWKEEVELVIYNLLGQEVAVLEESNKLAGYHKVEWDASNLSTGVYFYKLTAGSFTDTKKLLFFK